MDDRNRKKTQQPLKTDTFFWKRLFVLAAITAVIDLIFYLFSVIAIGGNAGTLYLKMVFYPLSAFVSSFLLLIITRKMLPCILCEGVVHLIFYWMTVAFSFSAFLWNILYLFSAFMGMGIAYIAVTSKKHTYIKKQQ